MKIDAHHHFWKYDSIEYDWIDENMQSIRRDFLPIDLDLELKKANVDGVVSVQARQSLEETDWLLSLASQNDFIKGVVGWVDLCSDEIDIQLKKYSQHRKMVGVRHVVQGEPDDKFMLRDDFLNGISLLEKYGLTYDILIYPRHLPIALEMVKMFPNQKFVLDHLAKPFIKSGTIVPWKADIEKLAECPNVFCKISGLVTEADWDKWSQSTFKPYLDVVCRSFGYERLMLGSDWPVCLLAGEYSEVLNIPRTYFQLLNEKDRAAIEGGNAVKFYNL